LLAYRLKGLIDLGFLGKVQASRGMLIEFCERPE